MEVKKDENLMFVNLIEELKDILERSQVPSAKKKKQIATVTLIEKWKQQTGKQLTESALLKKITNLKVRAKSAVNRGVQLTSWQSRLLEITKGDAIDETNSVDGPEHEESGSVEIEISQENCMLLQQSDPAKVYQHEASGFTVIQETEAVGNSQNFMDQFEAEQTRGLTNEQLQRIVFLQQITVLELQKKKLESEVNNANPIMFDLSGLNVSSILQSNEQ